MGNHQHPSQPAVRARMMSEVRCQGSRSDDEDVMIGSVLAVTVPDVHLAASNVVALRVNTRLS